MGLADTFQSVIDSLPDDWTDLAFDLRINEEDRYIEAATYMVQVNPQPYSKADWHWQVLVAHRFGHAASVPAVHGTLKLMDDAGFTGEMQVTQVREGRIETTYLPRRAESFRREFHKLRNY